MTRILRNLKLVSHVFKLISQRLFTGNLGDPVKKSIVGFRGINYARESHTVIPISLFRF